MSTFGRGVPFAKQQTDQHVPQSSEPDSQNTFLDSGRLQSLDFHVENELNFSL